MGVVNYNVAGTVFAVILISLGAYTALALARRARAMDGSVRFGWLAASSAVLGLAIWSMHFIAIVSTTFTTPVSFDIRAMSIALVTAVPIIASAFLPLCREHPGPVRVIAAGTIMGIGICVLHYLGMTAIRGVHPAYDPLRVAGSAFLAAGSSTLVLLLAVRRQGHAAQIASAVGLGLAIAATHYVGMSAACFHSDPALVERGGSPVRWVAIGIAAATVMLFLMALLAILFDRRIAEMAARETELIRRSEQRLRSILEQLPLGIGLADRDTGRLSIVNRRAHHLLGDDINPALLGRAASPDAGSPDGSEAGGTGPHGFVGGRIVDYTDAGGRNGNLEVWATRILNEEGGPDHVVYAFQDVTSRLSAEAELRQAQKMEAVGQLTGGIAHDFNNLLTAVLGNLDLLSLHLRHDEEKHLLRNAIEATERGARLTSQLLGFSRRQSLRPEIVQVNDVVDGMAELLASTLGGTVQVQTVPTPDLWPALADQTQLELVVLNLAINARDAMPLGGTILIRTENVWTGRPAAAGDPPSGEHVLLSVSDTGVGMTPETLARVFEPFFTTKPPGKGSGLGLSQVLGIAQQLGGGVRIKSELGQGTTVQLFVPRGMVADEPKALGHSALELDGTPLVDRTVLLVDDDRDVRVSACSTLALLGCTVIEASSGRAAIELVAEHGDRLDAVVMDYAMPEMTGLEAAEWISASLPDMPILIVTGYADPDMLGSAPKRFPILGKPFRGAQLAAKLGPMMMMRPQSGRTARVVPFPASRDRRTVSA